MLKRREFLEKQIARNIKIGSQFEHTPDLFVSRVFTVLMRNGKHRMIIDSSDLNAYVNKASFKMEEIPVLQLLIERNDYLVSRDLLESLHIESKKYVPLNMI